MNKIFYFLTITLIFTCCGVPKSDYNKLKSDNEKLDSAYQNLKQEVEKLKEGKSSNKKTTKSKSTESNFEDKSIMEEKPQSSSKSISEYDALQYVDDWYNFYNADMQYRNPSVRRISNNKFYISVEECQKSFTHDDFFWRSVVLVLNVKNNGKYTVDYSF
jgi:hypothetical protein